jgi:hypothetical protein
MLPFSILTLQARATGAAAARALVALAALAALTACGDDTPTKPTGPLTIKFETLAIRAGGTTLDTISGRAILDGRDTIRIPNDSFVNVARGEHEFTFEFETDYMSTTSRGIIDPFAKKVVYEVSPAGTCRSFTADATFCQGRNLLYWSQHRRILCPANDYGEFCVATADRAGVGATWPNDTNQYITRGKLLIAATLGAGSPGAGSQMATAFESVGDYAPRTRLRVVPADSSRYSNEVWTDVRHVPAFPAQIEPLNPGDRENLNLGLSVQATYYLPQQYGDALFIRYDVTNISNRPRYRLVNPEEPLAGHTVQGVYLVPMIDPDIGGTAQNEAIDDNATVFPRDSLIVAYDQAFSVPTFSPSARANPGVVGLQLVSGPPGTTARALILDTGDSLSFATAAREATTYSTLAAGRAVGIASCTGGTPAYVCAPEAGSNVRVGWSVGPVAALAPGQTTSITVAVLFANPKAGTFTSGTAIAPRNDALMNTGNNTGSPLFDLTEPLRTLSAQVRRLPVAQGPLNP